MAANPGRKNVHAVQHPCRCPFSAIHQIKICMMQDMAANPSRKSTRCKTCCRCHACRCPFNVVHILHHSYFYLVNSIERAPTRMLHSVYFFSTRGDSHILHHASFFFARECVLHRNNQGVADTPQSTSIEESVAMQGNSVL